MVEWFVFISTDEAGENTVFEAKYSDVSKAKAALFDQITAKGSATIEYKLYKLYEEFKVTLPTGEIYFGFIAGTY